MKRCGPPMGDRRTKRRVARPEREREAVEDQHLERSPERKWWWDAVDRAAKDAPKYPGHCPRCERLLEAIRSMECSCLGVGDTCPRCWALNEEAE